MKVISSATAIANIAAAAVWAGGPDWLAEVGTSIESADSSLLASANTSVTPSFSLGADWSIDPTLAWSTSSAFDADTLSHALVPSISVTWSGSDVYSVSAGWWVSALEDPLDEGGSLAVSAEFDPMEGLSLGGGLSGGWSQAAQWFGSVGASAGATFSQFRPGCSVEVTYATVPVSMGGKSTKSLYTIQTSAQAHLDVLLGAVVVGPDGSWYGYSYDKTRRKSGSGNSSSIAGSHSEWYFGSHLKWQAADWLMVQASGGRRWTDGQSSIDAAPRMNSQGKPVVKSGTTLSDATVDYAGASASFSW
ncbi:MAG: hypothetical protein IPK50_18895 [Fibrobacterota bacterium]|nr:MAG: hypothetical protein IPK50_18895 [Fibrobacterota bacterium]